MPLLLACGHLDQGTDIAPQLRDGYYADMQSTKQSFCLPQAITLTLQTVSQRDGETQGNIKHHVNTLRLHIACKKTPNNAPQVGSTLLHVVSEVPLGDINH
ncbi:hypothetical protein AMECASPLE_013885 [Ameca splendens]|uniref:Uncharacterized protein n=1 Tax=Ameca splendens TaxID=208324 RepID=A0ABV0Y1B8_9TELE